MFTYPGTEPSFFTSSGSRTSRKKTFLSLRYFSSSSVDSSCAGAANARLASRIAAAHRIRFILLSLLDRDECLEVSGAWAVAQDDGCVARRQACRNSYGYF